MRASILTIGDELLIGQVVNTNAAWLGEQLSLLGVEVTRVETVGDEETVVQEALERALEAADLVVLSGGLGPTHDDVTREVVAAVFGVALHTDAAVLAHVEDRFRQRRRSMPALSRRMALVPDGFDVLPNAVGAAPGLWQVVERSGRRCILVVLPGVPRELRSIFQKEIVPRLQQEGGLRVIAHRTLLTVGIGESNLQEALGDLPGVLGPQMRLAYLPHVSGVRVRLTALGDDHSEVLGRLDALEARLRDQVGAFVFGVDCDTLEAVVGRLLTAKGLTLAVAESCTGGLALSRLTDVPGSSAYVIGGVVAYSNAVKIKALGVDPRDLEALGAVSEVVALQMARGVRERFGADLGIATTGVAGPSGGTPEKPVGTVWIAWADADEANALLLHLGTDRLMNKERAATAVLDLVRRRLSG